MSTRKIDYRVTVPPRNRPTKCQNAIRKALRKGKKTFGNLLDETGLSRSTLASHLKEMHKKEEVAREPDPKDYRVTLYSLDKNGMDELRRQEDIETLSSAETRLSFEELVLPFGKAVAKLIESSRRFLEPSLREDWFRSVAEDYNLGECVTSSIYYDRSSLGNAGSKNYVSELAELAKTTMLSKYVTDPRYLEKTNNLILVFRFDKNKLSQVKRYLQKVKAEMKREPLLKLPNKEKYLKSQNKKLPVDEDKS